MQKFREQHETETSTQTETKQKSKTIGTVAVMYGTHDWPLQQIEGMTVKEARKIYEGPLNIDKEADALVNGNAVSDGYVLKAKDVLEFVRQSGSKGN